MDPLTMLAIASTGLKIMDTFNQAEIAQAKGELGEAQLEVQRQADEYKAQLAREKAQRQRREALAKRALQAAASGTTDTSTFLGQIEQTHSEYLRGLEQINMGLEQQQDLYDIKEAKIEMETPTDTDAFLTALGQAAEGGVKSYAIESQLGQTNTAQSEVPDTYSTENLRLFNKRLSVNE